MDFPVWKLSDFYPNFDKTISQSVNQEINIDSDNGLGLSRLQPIIWTTCVMMVQFTYAYMGHSTSMR